jgi:hypothetical protein
MVHIRDVLQKWHRSWPLHRCSLINPSVAVVALASLLNQQLVKNMSHLRQFEVTFDILLESRTNTFLGASRSDVQNKTMIVQASDPNTAQRMVEGMFGWEHVVVKHAYPV